MFDKFLSSLKPAQLSYLAIALLFGLFWYGNSQYGYARASDFNDVKHAVKELIVGTIEGKIVDARRLQCGAIKEGNAKASAYYGDRVRELNAIHHEKTGEYFPAPSCDEL